jgi:hypothetical protein
MRKANVNRNPALLFLREPIAIDAGQRAQKSCFSMIDMTGRSKNQRAGIHLRFNVT